MLQFDLSAQERSSFGKGASKSLRSAGQTPAIIYGAKKEPLALKIGTKELMKSLLTLQRRNAVFNIDVEGEGAKATRHAMVKEVQTHPIYDTLVHADFCEVSLERPIVLEVPIKYVGVAKGVELGGELLVSLSSITVKGLILDIPDFFEIDVAPLSMGQKLTCEVLQVAGNVEVLNGKEDVCVSVQVPKRGAGDEEGEEEETPADEAVAE